MTAYRAQRLWLTSAAAGRIYWRRWIRSRDPLAVLVFAGILCFYDASAKAGDTPSPWWSIVVFLAAWSGFLAGYDTYERLRSDGSLRLIVLRGAPRLGIALGFAGAATATALLAVALAVMFLLLTGRTVVSADTLIVLAGGCVAAAGTVTYAQCMSLVLPKDTAAVLGVLALVFGASAFDRWLPPGTPESVRALVHGLWSSIPTTYRLSQFAAGHARVSNVAVMLLQAGVGLAACGLLLNRPALLARTRSEG